MNKTIVDVEGRLERIIYPKDKTTNKNIYVILLIKNNGIEYKIKGDTHFLPSVGDNILARGKLIEENKEWGLQKIINNSKINIDLPLEYNDKITRLKEITNNTLSHNELVNIVSNNEKLWKTILQKTLKYNIDENKVLKLYDDFEKYYKTRIITNIEQDKLENYLINNDIKLKSNQIEQLLNKYIEAKIIIKKCEENLLDLLEVDTISIKTLHKIATSLNYTFEQKIELDIKYYLNYDEKGNTCVKILDLNNTLLQNPNITQKLVDKTMQNLKNKKIVIEFNGYYYDKILYDAECNIAKVLNNVNNENCILKKIKKEVLEDLNKNHKLNIKQKEALVNIFNNNINIIIGQAGTGKSHILKTLCRLISEYRDISCLFLTPTGKACDRLRKSFKSEEDTSGETSFTIHKFIYYNEENKKGCIKEFNNILNNKIKIFIIDEMSMVSLLDFNMFLNKINKLHNVVLVFLGDTNQLPSVSSGDVLNQLIKSKCYNITELNEICRSDSLGLLTVQKNILNCEPITTLLNDNTFEWIQVNPLKEKDIVIKKISEYNENTLIITTTNKIVDEYQNEIKSIHNKITNNNFYILNKIKFNIGDKIIMTTNDYEHEIFNGMTGKIINIYNEFINDNEFEEKIDILFDGDNQIKSYEKIILLNAKLAYILTIHKSQGSESDNVIILLNDGIMNNINLLYTAITRAKKKCILISEKYPIQRIIEEKLIIKRKSNLSKFCKTQN